MSKWEYMETTIFLVFWVRDLNDLGKRGWELVGFEEDGIRRIATFKREIKCCG